MRNLSDGVVKVTVTGLDGQEHTPPEPTIPPRIYTYGSVSLRGRSHVSEPIDPKCIRIPLNAYGSGFDTAYCDLTVMQALDVIRMLTERVSDACKRHDIQDALRRTDPLPATPTGVDRGYN